MRGAGFEAGMVVGAKKWGGDYFRNERVCTWASSAPCRVDVYDLFLGFVFCFGLGSWGLVVLGLRDRVQYQTLLYQSPILPSYNTSVPNRSSVNDSYTISKARASVESRKVRERRSPRVSPSSWDE